MNEFVEKIVEKLEELRQIEYDREDYIDEDGLYNDCEEAFADGESNGRYQAYVRIMKFIIEIEKEYNNGWIPCSERLPEESGEYLTYVDYADETFIAIDEIDCDGLIKEWNCTPNYHVIAWQPLPKPYKKLTT